MDPQHPGQPGTPCCPMLSQATAGIIGFRALWAGGGRNRLKNPEIISPKKSSKTDILRIQIMEVWLEDDVSFSIWMAKEWPRCPSAKDVNGKEVTRMAKEWRGWVINWQVAGMPMEWQRCQKVARMAKELHGWQKVAKWQSSGKDAKKVAKMSWPFFCHPCNSFAILATFWHLCHFFDIPATCQLITHPPHSFVILANFLPLTSLALWHLGHPFGISATPLASMPLLCQPCKFLGILVASFAIRSTSLASLPFLWQPCHFLDIPATRLTSLALCYPGHSIGILATLLTFLPLL